MKRMKEMMKKIGVRIAVISAFFTMTMTNAFADTGDPVAAINKLKTLVTSLVSAVGGVILLWSIVQLGIGIKRHDPAAFSENILGVVAGLVIAAAPWVVTYIVG